MMQPNQTTPFTLEFTQYQNLFTLYFFVSGINDLYVHVAVDNEAALKLYGKSGFVYENEEPAWQARFLGRPRRFLLWTDLSQIELVV